MTRQECIRLNVAQVRDDGIGFILEKHALELTRCVDCALLEFVHESGCPLAERIEEIGAWIDNPQEEAEPPEMGTLVYVT